MSKDKPQILLTNDDGIESPGLWAAAEALSEIGYVWVAAPREQQSSTGRSMPLSSDGRITVQQLQVNGQEWSVHAVGGTPAQTVQHGILEIMGQTPDLVVSGINYGLNLGMAVTISGTVGAALESASYGIPSLAVSLETPLDHFYTYSKEIDFSSAAYFTAKFGKDLLEGKMPKGVDLLKIEVPNDASPQTPWTWARMSLMRYYVATAPERGSWDDDYKLGYYPREDYTDFEPDSDVYAVHVDRKVAVTPLTLDMTAHVPFEQLDKRFRE